MAVVLPELQAALAGRFEVGAVPLDSQEAIARRFGLQRWPALVFLRDGQYVTTLAGMHDWRAPRACRRRAQSMHAGLARAGQSASRWSARTPRRPPLIPDEPEAPR